MNDVPNQTGTVGTAFSLNLASSVSLTNGDAILSYAIASGTLPTGVTLSFEGNYKSQKENSQRLALVFMLGIIMIFGVLYYAFKSSHTF